MAINMELTLFAHMLVIITIHCLIPEEHLSSENINEILDKLIIQTQQINETGLNADIKDLPPIVETQTDNDSNIYYIKTYMPPNISFKSSSEILQALHSNKTDQSRDVFNEAHIATSEAELYPGASMITMKSGDLKQFIPRLVHGDQKTVHAEFRARTGHIDENQYSLDDILKKQKFSELNTTNDNQSGHQIRQSNIFHEYPEIIIDHITYDNDETDKNKLPQVKPPHVASQLQNIVKEEPNNRIVQPRKIHYNIPEEEIEVPEHEPPEYFEPRSYVSPEMNGLIAAIIQKKMMHEAFLKQTTDNESRKKNVLIGKILQRLPESRRMINNVKSSYTLHQERNAPLEIESISHFLNAPEILHRSGGSHLTKSYVKVPLVPNKLEIHNPLLKTLVRMYRPNILKNTHVFARLINRIVRNIDYQPVYYDLYKK